MRYIRYILSIPLKLNILVLLATIFVLIPKKIYEFNNDFISLCVSIIASYIFYFIVVHLKQEKDKDNINIFVAKKVFRIVSDYKKQIQDLKNFTNISTDEEYLSEVKIQSIYSKIDLNIHNATLYLSAGSGKAKQANWIEYTSHYSNQSIPNNSIPN